MTAENTETGERVQVPPDADLNLFIRDDGLAWVYSFGEYRIASGYFDGIKRKAVQITGDKLPRNTLTWIAAFSREQISRLGH